MAEAARAAHPGVEPQEAHPVELAGWIAAAGGDPDDPVALAAVLRAWESLLP